MQLRLFKDKYFKEMGILTGATLLFILSLQAINPLPFLKGRVIDVKDYKTTIRQGFDLYELKGEKTYQLDDKVSLDTISLYENPSQYQKSRRIKGEILDSHLIKSPFSFKRMFHHKMPETLKAFFDREIDTIFSLFSLQLLGLLSIIRSFTSSLIYRKDRHKLDTIIILIYAYFFGLTFSVMRILFRTLLKKKERVLSVLLILYPHSFYDMGFNLVYLPMILKSFMHLFSNVDFRMMRMFWLLRLTGKIQILEILFYPILKLFAGTIVLLCLLLQFNLATSLLNLGMKFTTSHRLLLVGSPSIFWLYFYLLKEKKTQIVVFILMCIMMQYPFYTQVSFMNVYQGDASLIQLPFNAITILIDTGRQSAYKTLKKSLYKQAVKKIDYLVITHPDLDHAENIDAIMKDFKVDHLITKKSQSVPFLTPFLNDIEYEDENENSLIYMFKTKQASFMFMGDAGVTQEKAIIKREPHLEVDVLKLGHHGSRTSSSKYFVENLKPSLAIISSDPRIYNHPHPEVMKTLYKARIMPLQTSEEGNIIFKLLPFMKLIVSEGGGFGIME